MALFGFGAFSTPIGSLIGEENKIILNEVCDKILWYLFLLQEQATDNSASAGNIALHLQICDAVNDNDAG